MSLGESPREWALQNMTQTEWDSYLRNKARNESEGKKKKDIALRRRKRSVRTRKGRRARKWEYSGTTSEYGVRKEIPIPPSSDMVPGIGVVPTDRGDDTTDPKPVKVPELADGSDNQTGKINIAKKTRKFRGEGAHKDVDNIYGVNKEVSTLEDKPRTGLNDDFLTPNGGVAVNPSDKNRSPNAEIPLRKELIQVDDNMLTDPAALPDERALNPGVKRAPLTASVRDVDLTR